MWMSASTSSLRVDRGADRFDIRGAGALADQQALRLDPQHDGHQHQQRADGQGADRVERTVAGDDRQADAEEGEHQPEQCRNILQQHDRQLRRLGVPDELEPAVVAAHAIGLAHGGAQRERLEHHRHDAAPAIGSHGVFQRVRMRELVDALVDREHPADAEQDDGDHERVDVPLAAVAERMLRVGLALRRRRPPRSSSTWLPVSATECTASASIEADPETAHAMNLVIAIPRFASIAAMIALVPPSALTALPRSVLILGCSDMDTLPAIAILGAGSMGGAILSGLVQPGVAVSGPIRVTNRTEAKAAGLRSR